MAMAFPSLSAIALTVAFAMRLWPVVRKKSIPGGESWSELKGGREPIVPHVDVKEDQPLRASRAYDAAA